MKFFSSVSILLILLSVIGLSTATNNDKEEEILTTGDHHLDDNDTVATAATATEKINKENVQSYLRGNVNDISTERHLGHYNDWKCYTRTGPVMIELKTWEAVVCDDVDDSINWNGSKTCATKLSDAMELGFYSCGESFRAKDGGNARCRAMYQCGDFKTLVV